MINNQASLNDQFNPWLAVDETNGRLVVIYYDTVDDPGRLRTDVWYQTSSDDGVTWSTSVKVTTAQTDETVAGADSGNQYGDYNGLSGYAGKFFSSWTDRRNGSREEIWTAPILVSTTPGIAKAWDVIILPVVLNQLYQQVLERQVDPVGLIGWGCMLSRGEQSMRDIVRNIGYSQEYHDRFIAPLTTADAVRACYRHFLARDAEPAGLQYWEAIATQQGFLPVIDGIVGSDEYTNKFGNDQVPH